MAPLVDKKVVIIGGTSGIGFAVAKAVLAEGGHVVIGSSSNDKVRAAAKRLTTGDRVTAEVVDISREESVKALFEKVGKFEHLVITAGGIGGAATSFPTGDLGSLKEKAFDARFWGALYCIKYSHGNVADSVTITSGAGIKRPMIPGLVLVAGALGAIMTSIRTLAVDLAPLRFNCIVPGVVDTELLDTLPKEQKELLLQKYSKELPVKHVGRPEEVAEAYLFAMKCTYFTGQELYVEGGQLLV